MKMTLTTPEKFFGDIPGSDNFIIRWNKLCDYYRQLETESDRIKVKSPGKTTEGNDFLILYVSHPDNIARLNEYGDISKRLANDETLTDEEIKALSKEGKVIVFQSYSLHPNEIGGSQTVPSIVYELLTAESGSELYEAIKDVIFIISPCSEPDGEIKYHDFFQKYKGTRFHGFCSPYIRHKLAGHCNNRDAFFENCVESKYLNDEIIRGYCPQLIMDHHHLPPYDYRMSIAPVSNPIFPHISPLLINEECVSGSVMARDLMAAGRTGIISGNEEFPSFPINSFYGNARLHNLNGMLTESADVRIGAPTYVHPSRLTTEPFPTVQCPSPWKGGEWHLSDIVTNIRLASLSLIKHGAKNKELILSNMALKAKMQTQQGLENDKQAFLLPKAQHDPSTLAKLIGILLKHEVRVYETSKELTLNGRVFPKGTYTVPLAQPKYAVVMLALDRSEYPINKYCYLPDGSLRIFDNANLSVVIPMGIESVPAYDKISLDDLIPVKEIPTKAPTFPLPANENDSYSNANALLKGGVRLYRDADGNFHKEDGEGRYEVRRARVAVYDRGDSSGNQEEGFTNNFLITNGFDWCNITDKEIRENEIPDDIDVIIFPGDRDFEIGLGDNPPRLAPVEYQTGIGSVGLERIKRFMSRGGRVISWERSNVYFNKVLDLGMCNKVEGLGEKEFMPYGSQINVELFGKSEFTFGMPKRFSAIFNNFAPAFYPLDIVHRCDVFATIAKEKILNCGFMTGENHLAGIPGVIRHEYDDGDIILYAFSPIFRCQQDSTYKLLSNALFLRCNRTLGNKTIHYRHHLEIPMEKF